MACTLLWTFMKASFDFRLWRYTYLTSSSVLDLAGCGLTSNQGLVFHAAFILFLRLYQLVFALRVRPKKPQINGSLTCFCALFSKFQWTATKCNFSLLYLSWHDKGVKLLVSWLLGFDSGFETNLSSRGTKAKLQQRRFIVKKQQQKNPKTFPRNE